VEIDRHGETLLEEELQVHEAGKSGWGIELDEEIKVMCSGIPACGGAKKPERLDAVGAEFPGEPLDGRNQCGLRR